MKNGKVGMADGLLVLSMALCLFSYMYMETSWGKLLFHMALAAGIAGLADWYAVRSLFHKPLGIGFHTDIIKNSRVKMMAAARNMLMEQIFTVPALYRLCKLHPPLMVCRQWIQENQELCTAWLARCIHVVLEHMDLEASIHGKGDVDLIGFAGPAVTGTLEDIKGDPFWDAVTREARRLYHLPVMENMLNRLFEEAVAYYGEGSTGRKMAGKLLLSKKEELLKQGEERFLQSQIIASLVEQAWSVWLQSLTGEKRQQLNYRLNQLFMKWVQNAVREETERDDAAQKIAAALIDWILALSGNRERMLERSFSYWLIRKIPDIHQLMDRTVMQWMERYSGHEISDFMEQSLYRDLQIIRVNGTLIGAVLGFLFELAYMAAGGI